MPLYGRRIGFSLLIPLTTKHTFMNRWLEVLQESNYGNRQ